MTMVRSGINTAEIPKVALNNLCRTTLEAVMRFYEDPANVALYDAWMKEGGSDRAEV